MAKSRALMFLVLLVSSLTVIACQEEPADNVALPKTQVKVGAQVAVPPFETPKNSSIDLTKARAYAAASSALIILGEQWSGRIEKASDEDKIRILDAYDKARDQVCARVGLAGVAEFNWITNVAMADSSNSEALAKAGIKVSR
jgi:hypothetical protein